VLPLTGVPLCVTVALIVVVPVPEVVKSPGEPSTATPAFEEFHDAKFVRISVVPSLNIPVATNCSELPRLMLGLAGVI